MESDLGNDADNKRLQGVHMNGIPDSQANMIETSDSLEAVGVFRGWKNIFFAVVLLCLLLTQAAFWLINLKIVAAPAAANAAESVAPPTAVATPSGQTAQPAAEKGSAASGLVARLMPSLDFDYTARVVELLNGILLVAGLLLAATTFFGLMVSLVGRLGGINHISRAFVLALITAVLLVPWQVLGLNVLGVTWTPAELVRWLPTKDTDLWNTVIFYLRFSGYWAAVTLLVLLAQIRSTCWSKSILRRLEII
ncbi:MAG: hypothetical protein M1376_20395 [Planctomycetes bacterium]|nr:hypothetical protein [Planctomycetota bacterium]